MYLLGLLCLLSAAMALPTPEQLQKNLLALPPLPPLPELNFEEKDESSVEKIVEPIPPPPELPPLDLSFAAVIGDSVNERTGESKISSKSAEKPVPRKDEDKGEPDDVKEVIKQQSKEPKESKESEELKNPNKSKECDKPKEMEHSKGENKESKPEEPKEDKNADEYPTFVLFNIKKPSLSGLFPHFSNFHWPSFNWLPFFKRFSYPGQPGRYLVKESVFDFL